MNNMQCETCKHWVDSKPKYQLPNDNFRMCVSVKYFTTGVLLESMGYANQNANMYTLPDFGCNRHEAKHDIGEST